MFLLVVRVLDIFICDNDITRLGKNVIILNHKGQTDQTIDWTEPEEDSTEEDINFSEYEISASPNDFNIKTLNDFIGSGIVKIPGFQRNYVWDIKRASKLIESIIIGIPIPQIFLYEERKNKFIVIDGQQRYMTIYYFMRKRFPRIEKRHELRIVFDKNDGIPETTLNDNEYFSDFNLQLHASQPKKNNKFNKLNYFTLDEEDRVTFDLRTIRNIIIKQKSPADDQSVMFEVFNRLNSGGINLKPQEIRTSLFHSDFFDMLYRINLNQKWRIHTPTNFPNLNMRDIEILLRGFAMLVDGEEYSPSLTKFLNTFSYKAKSFNKGYIFYLEGLFNKFIELIPNKHTKLFHNKETGRFNISVYESIFVATCQEAFKSKGTNINAIDLQKVENLRVDPEFSNATQSNTASSINVATRLRRAKEMLK